MEFGKHNFVTALSDRPCMLHAPHQFTFERIAYCRTRRWSVIWCDDGPVLRIGDGNDLWERRRRRWNNLKIRVREKVIFYSDNYWQRNTQHHHNKTYKRKSNGPCPSSTLNAWQTAPHIHGP